MDWRFPLSSYSYFKISNNTGVNSEFYGIRVATKSAYYSPSPYTVSWVEPSLPCFPCNNVVITPNSWHGRVLLLTPSPLKPLSRLSSLISCLIVCDCHDKRLRFFFYRSRTTVFHYFSCCSVFRHFLAQNGRFTFLRNVTSQIKFLKNKIPEYSDPPLQQLSIAQASISTFVSCRKVALCQSDRMAQRTILCMYLPGFQRQVFKHVPKCRRIPLTRCKWIPRTYFVT